MQLDENLHLNIKKYLKILYNIKKDRNCNLEDYQWLNASSRDIEAKINKISLEKISSQMNYGMSNPKYIELITNPNRLTNFVSQLYGGNVFSIRSLESLPNIISYIEEFLDEVGVKIRIHDIKEKLSTKVFIVHGQNKEIKTSVELLLRNIGLDPVILHKQPNSGKTIIEKFEKYSDVGYAVVILSPDDMGCSKNNFPNAARSRARQNVILELGYFMGTLGRNRVAAIFLDDGEFEFPTDILGVLYIPYKEGDSWKYKLVDEIKSAGFNVSKDNVN